MQSLLNGSYVSLTNKKAFLHLRATPVFHCCELIPSVCRLPLAQLVTPVLGGLAALTLFLLMIIVTTDMLVELPLFIHL